MTVDHCMVLRYIFINSLSTCILLGVVIWCVTLPRVEIKVKDVTGLHTGRCVNLSESDNRQQSIGIDSHIY